MTRSIIQLPSCRLNKRYAPLTNHEVVELLQSTWGEEKKKPGLKNLATICYETLQYLTETAPAIKSQTTEKITEFRKEMKRFQLNDNEIFMMVNDPPTSVLHIQLLIEDSEERLTEDQVNDILLTISRLLLPFAEMDNNESVEEEEIQDGEAVEQ